jgi:hypothetical protein
MGTPAIAGGRSATSFARKFSRIAPSPFSASLRSKMLPSGVLIPETTFIAKRAYRTL